MKKINLMVLLLAWMGTFAQHIDWAKRGGLWAYDYGNGIGTDGSGNVYIAGKFEYNANFSGVTLPNQGNHDMYVAKYNSSGGLTWIHSAGGPSGDYAHACCVKGNYVYVAGEIQGNYGTLIKFIGSSITLTTVGGNDAFVAKYDLSGNLLWARRAAAGYDDDKAEGVTADAAGNVYVCGYFRNNTMFGGTYVGGYGNNDIFVAKYDPNGNMLWYKHMGSSSRDEALGIKSDDAGNVYVCGMYKNGCNFMGQWLSAPNGYMNAYLAKINTYGNLVWVKTAGGNWDDVAWGVTIDNYGKVFTTGEFNADATFSGQHVYTSGKADVFVAAYNGDGSLAWVRKAGGALIDRARGIGTDGNNIYITGQFGWTATFGSYTRTAADSSDIFMAAISNSGNWLWANSAGGGADAYENLGYESGIAITALPTGEVYATGAMLNGAQFGSTYLSAYGRTDVFLTKLRNGVAAREATESPIASEDVMLEGKAVANAVALNWSYTADKRDMALDRSFDGENFTELKYYQAEEIKGAKLSYTDVSAAKGKSVQYRVRVIDVDGVTSFSRVLSVNTAESASAITMDVFPNPARTELAINLKGDLNQKVNVSIFDVSGRQVWQQDVESACKVDVSPWSRGIYVVVIQNDHAVLSRQKILVE